MKQRQQSTTSYPIVFLMVDNTDHVTGKTGLTPVVTLSKNGGAFAAAAGTVSEVGNGWYALAGNATDRNTLGSLAVHATGVGADPSDDLYVVVPWDPFDAVRMGLTALPNANAAAANGLPTNGTGSGQITLDAGRVTVAPAGLDPIVVETGLNARQALSVIASSTAGTLSGGGTSTITIKGAGVVTTRITATVDVLNNRTAVTLSPPA